MSQAIELSIEQQFELKRFESQVQGLNREQAQHLLTDLYRQMVIKEAAYQRLLRQGWGIQ